MTATAVILFRDTLSWPVISVEYHDYIPNGFSSDEADTKLLLKSSRGNNSDSIKARVNILVRDTLSWPASHNCEVS